MPIPNGFNGDLFLWLNQIVGDLSQSNSELHFIRLYWTQLTAGQKTAVKTKIQNAITTAKDSLDSISTEIGTL